MTASPAAPGMPSATPEMIAAAWAAWQARHGGKLGPGPAFVEAINAALAVCQAFEAKEREIARLKADRDSWRRVAERCESEKQAAEAKLAQAVEALDPLARLEIPRFPVGNAGAYSIRHADIIRARSASDRGEK